MLDKTTTTVVKICAATADEVSALKAVARALGRDRMATATAGDWHRELSRGTVAATVAIVDGNKIVGVMATTKLPLLDMAEVLLLFVAPNYRRRGIGKRLLQQAAKNAVRLIVPRSNNEALSLLRRAGFAASDDVLMVRSHEQ